jgi:hypothetical protein
LHCATATMFHKTTNSCAQEVPKLYLTRIAMCSLSRGSEPRHVSTSGASPLAAGTGEAGADPPLLEPDGTAAALSAPEARWLFL